MGKYMKQTLEMMRYATYEKPFFAPPDWLFGPVWSVLYVTIAIGFIWILNEVRHGRLPKWLAALVAVNVVSNLLFTPIQFGLNSLWLAWVDILIVLISLLWIEAALWIKKGGWVFWLLLPYTLWVMFATILQSTIAVMNS